VHVCRTFMMPCIERDSYHAVPQTYLSIVTD
jgi:hypothetical protein